MLRNFFSKPRPEKIPVAEASFIDRNNNEPRLKQLVSRYQNTLDLMLGMGLTSGVIAVVLGEVRASPEVTVTLAGATTVEFVVAAISKYGLNKNNTKVERLAGAFDGTFSELLSSQSEDPEIRELAQRWPMQPAEAEDQE